MRAGILGLLRKKLRANEKEPGSSILALYKCLKWYALGCTNALMPWEESVEPSPEFLRPDQGTLGLTLSQQFQ